MSEPNFDREPLGRPVPPGPGVGMAVVHCILFMVVTIGGALIVSGVAMYAAVSEAEDPTAELKEAAETLRAGGPIPDWLGRALAYGLGFGAVLTLVYPVLILKYLVGPQWGRKIALRKPSLEHTILILLALPAFMVGAGGIAELVGAISGGEMPAEEQQFESIFEQTPVFLAVLMIGVAPGVGEELFFRGFLNRGLTARLGLYGGLLVTSLLFGMVHTIPPQKIAITAFMGAWLHFIYLMSRSLLLPILIHFANNTMGVLAGYELIPPEALGENPASPLAVYAATVSMLAAVGYALYQGRARNAPINPDGETWQPPLPSVALPPEGRNTRVESPYAGGLAWGLVLLASAGFAAALFVK